MSENNKLTHAVNAIIAKANTYHNRAIKRDVFVQHIETLIEDEVDRRTKTLDRKVKELKATIDYMERQRGLF